MSQGIIETEIIKEIHDCATRHTGLVGDNVLLNFISLKY